MTSRSKSAPHTSPRFTLLSKFDDLFDSACGKYNKLPAIPDKKGRMPGEKRRKKEVLHLPPLDPTKFPTLHNPDLNGLALDPMISVKKRQLAMVVDEIDDAEKTVSQKLAAALRENSARVLDLFRQLDENDDGVISRSEFIQAFQQENNLLEGVDVSTKHAAQLFDEWDADRSGTIEFDELRTLLKKRPAARASTSP